MLEAIDLSKRYEDRFLATDHQHIRIECEEIYVPPGANGAGMMS